MDSCERTARAPDELATGADARAALHDRALGLVAESLRPTIVLIDATGVITMMSDDVCELLGVDEADVVGRNGFELLHPDHLDEAVTMFQGALDRSPTARRLTVRLRTSAPEDDDGNAWRWVEIFARSGLDDPELDAIVLSVRDVQDRIHEQQHLRRLDQIMGATTDFLLMLDREFRIIWANAAAEAYLPEGAVAQRLGIETRVPRWVMRTFSEDILPQLREAGIWTGEVSVLDREDRALPVDTTWVLHRDSRGRAEYSSIIGRDITSRLELERQLNVQARTDPLTGVGNRQAAIDGLARSAERGAVGLSIIDVANFRTVNDTHGHGVGDRLLAEVGRRLRSEVFSSQLVARLGGDEFGVIWPGIATHDDAVRMTRRLLDDVVGVVNVGDEPMRLELRAGVAFTTRGGDPAVLMQEATKAIQRAKELDDDHVVGFDEALRTLTEQRETVARDIPAGVTRGEFESWFQPLIDAATGEVSSCEALVRWQHPERGLLFPDMFIPVAEETGSIVELGAAVIHRACMHAARWPEVTGLDHARVAVNVSARQLADPGLVAVLDNALRASQMAPEQLTVEITESLLMSDLDAAAVLLDDLRLVGVQVAIDDFGTGYSSLAYLQDLPIDVLKIDRRFVSPLGQRRLGDYSLVAGIVSIAKSLGLSVVAEGVETAEQADLLRELGVDTLQGYLFAKPMPHDELVRWCRAHGATSASAPHRSGPGAP